MNMIKPEEVGLCSTRLNRINDLTSAYINRGELAGTVTLVARHGKIAHLVPQGSMNLAANQSMSADTIFRIYSMTKPITSVAAMILYERGEFDLTTPIARFIPEFKNVEVYVEGSAEDYTTIKPEREITMVDLLTHTAGLTYDFANQSVVEELYRKAGLNPFDLKLDLTTFVKNVAKMPLLFSPGSRWNYSVATDVLGRIIEIISGVSLDVFFKKEIFDVLGMEDTGFYVPLEKQQRFAVNYMNRSIAPRQLTESHPEQSLFMLDDPREGQYSTPPVMHSGGGGLVSTAADYLKFAEMLVNEGRVGDRYLISPRTFKLMTTNHLPCELHDYRFNKNGGSFNPGVGMGLGFSVTLGSVEAAIIGNRGDFGWTGAANTYFFIDPKEKMTAIFLAQLFPFDLTSEMYRRFKVAVYQSVIN